MLLNLLYEKIIGMNNKSVRNICPLKIDIGLYTANYYYANFKR